MNHRPLKDTVTRAGFVAIVGRPNVGKSTLLNAFVGEHLTAVSRKEQTTRRVLRGIVTRADSQFVFVDTPGLLDPTDPLQETLVEAAYDALDGIDAAYVLTDDPDVPAAAESVLSALRREGVPTFLVITKRDVITPGERRAIEEAWGEAFAWREVHVVSAVSGEGLEDLLASTAACLPEQPFFYDPDDLTDASLRSVAAELIREACYEELEQELPYSVHVTVDEWEEPGDPGGTTAVRATIYVERESQKGIVVGKGGAKLKAIGVRARRSIEELTGSRFHLGLWVKVRKKWSRREADLKFFGYRS